MNLTEFSKNGGCAAKVNPEILTRIFQNISFFRTPNVIVGVENNSDCGIYKLNDEISLVQSVDFFPPMVDNAYDFGAIAAANALSDLYTAGAEPISALNILCFPENRLPENFVKDIFTGAIEKLKEANAVILGGHTINDETIKFGMAVTGIVKNKDIIKNSNARVGDKIILTKAVGVGLINTAVKMKLKFDKEVENSAIRSMKQLNKDASLLLKKYKVNACTDITGFSLIGHSFEMAYASNVTILIDSGKIPIIQGINDFLLANAKCGGAKRNINFYETYVTYESSSPLISKNLLFDPQTSGGLLISVEANDSKKLLDDLKIVGYDNSAEIGEVVHFNKNNIKII